MSIAQVAEFDWKEEAVAIPRQRAIAVHLTADFDIVIRQQGENGEPDAVVEIARQNCLDLCAKILHQAAEHQFRLMRLPDGIVLTGDGKPVRIPREIADKLFQQFDEED